MARLGHNTDLWAVGVIIATITLVEFAGEITRSAAALVQRQMRPEAVELHESTRDAVRDAVLRSRDVLHQQREELRGESESWKRDVEQLRREARELERELRRAAEGPVQIVWR